MKCPSAAEKVEIAEDSNVQMIKLHLKLVVMKDQETSCTKVKPERGLVVCGILGFFPNKGVKEGHCQPPEVKKICLPVPKVLPDEFQRPLPRLHSILPL